MTKTKPPPKPIRLPPRLVENTENSNTSSDSTAAADQQFEVELYWCIHQLQTALNLGKLSSKQVQDHTTALNVLMSKTAPLVRKRQVMRCSFGDYRSKMAAEEKKFSKVNMQVKLSPGKPSSKSIFVKKSTIASSDNNFAFNFEVPKSNEEMVVDNVEDKTEKQTKKCKDFNFAPSDNSFKFDFSVTN